MSTIRQLLDNATVKDLIRVGKPKLISFNPTTNLDVAAQKLAKNKILSAPILNEEDNSVLGFVDVLDILKYIVQVQPDPLDLVKDDLSSLRRTSVALNVKVVGDIVNFSGKDPYVALDSNESLTKLFKLFAKGVHRVAVMHLQDEEKDETHAPVVVSQSDAIKFLMKRIVESQDEDLQEISSKALGQLGYKKGPVVPVPGSATVRKALEILWEKQVSALPVLDKNGSIIGSFSPPDTRGLFAEMYPNLPHFQDSVEQFLRKYAPKSISSVPRIETHSKLGDVIKMAYEEHLHHLWIVEHDKPQGIVTLTDIIKIVLKQ